MSLISQVLAAPHVVTRLFRATFPGTAWQRCPCLLQRDAQACVTKHDLKPRVAAGTRAILNAPSQEEAKRLLAAAVEKYAKTRSKLFA